MEPTIIAAIVTFVGTLIGTLALYVIQKRVERRTINRALLVEISRLLKVFIFHSRWWLGCTTREKTSLPLIVFTTDIYDRLIQNIGNIDRRHADLVVSFYGFVKFMNNLQASRSQYLAAHNSTPFINSYSETLVDVLQFANKFDKSFKRYKVNRVRPVDVMHLSEYLSKLTKHKPAAGKAV